MLLLSKCHFKLSVVQCCKISNIQFSKYSEVKVKKDIYNVTKESCSFELSTNPENIYCVFFSSNNIKQLDCFQH